MLAIVPARGGSKGLPGKNIKQLHGKPMIAYTIEAAMKSSYISEVIVSTDDKVVADIAVSYGATCPFLRPDELASDDALAIDNYIYTIEKLNAEYGYKIDEFIVLQPTSPLRTDEDIDAAISIFIKNQADSVVSYVEEEHPVHWHKYINDKNEFEDIFDNKIKNRQDFRKTYYPNGAIFIFKYELIKSRQYYSKRSYAYVMPKKRSIDVDYLSDFEYVEFLMSRKNDHE